MLIGGQVLLGCHTFLVAASDRLHPHGHDGLLHSISPLREIWVLLDRSFATSFGVVVLMAIRGWP